MKDSIGIRLKYLMASKEISGVELAMRSDVKPSFIYDVLSGKSGNPSTVKLARVAEALGISIAELVESAANINLPSPPSREYVAVPPLDITQEQDTSPIPAIGQGEPYYFRRTWIKERLGSAPENLRMGFVRGDCMEPTLHPNDLILVDVTGISPSPPGIFVLFDGFGFITRRLEYETGAFPAVIRLLSDNTQYTPYTIPAQHLNIIGRVVWFSREI